MVNDMLVIIKESFRYAQNCNVPVICNFSEINIKKSYREMRVLSSLEEKKLISVLLQDIDLYKLGVYICLYTGIRNRRALCFAVERYIICRQYVKNRSDYAKDSV